MPPARQRKQIYKEITKIIENPKFCKDYRGGRGSGGTSLHNYM